MQAKEFRRGTAIGSMVLVLSAIPQLAAAAPMQNAKAAQDDGVIDPALRAAQIAESRRLEDERAARAAANAARQEERRAEEERRAQDEASKEMPGRATIVRPD